MTDYPTLDDFEEAKAKLSKKNSQREDVLEAAQLMLRLEPEGTEEQAQICSELVDQGVIYAFVNTLHTYKEDPEILKLIVHTLKKIGSVDSYLQAVVEYDVPGRIIFTCGQNLNQEVILSDGILLLGYLASNDHVKDLIRMQQGIELIIECMRTYPDDAPMLDKCCYTLANLANNCPANITTFIQAGGMEHVISALNNHADHLDLCESATILLANMSTHTDQTRTVIVSSGGVGSLSKMLAQHYSHETILEATLRALGNLALVRENAQVFFSEEILATLIHVTKIHAMSEESLCACLGVIGNLIASSNADQLSTFFRSGAVSTLIEISRSNAVSVQVQLGFLSCLANFVNEIGALPDDERQSVLQEGIPAILFAVHQLDWEESVIALALRVLTRLTTDEKIAKTMIQVQVPRTLAHLLTSIDAQTKPEIYRATLHCLSELAKAETTDAMVESGVLPLLLKILEQGHVLSEKITTTAMKVLVNMAVGGKPSYMRMIADQSHLVVLNAGEGGTLSQSVEFLRLAGWFFSNLAHHKGAVNVLFNAGLADNLLTFLEAHADSPDVTVRFVAALKNLVLTDKRFKVEMRRLEAVSRCRAIHRRFADHALLAQNLESFAAAVNAADEVKVDKRLEGLTPYERYRQMFNPPTIDAGVRIVVTAGKKMIKYSLTTTPHERYVFVSRCLRFVVWKDQSDKDRDPKSIFLLHAKEIKVGDDMTEFRRSWPGKRAPVADHCFSVIGATRNLCVECESQYDRDKWVENLKAVIAYQREIEERKRFDESEIKERKAAMEEKEDKYDDE
eukprot:TRINITY_DN4348_c0_g3_i3.p1 TRINITY_DN4348_c0_g3~~TRINITY_DN4348_c0_g3_i3.p1  ORF type:complete len:812 (-),score=254.63 TRINITY_DN4348_c0_g3_i3:285-2669(-)